MTIAICMIKCWVNVYCKMLPHSIERKTIVVCHVMQFFSPSLLIKGLLLIYSFRILKFWENFITQKFLLDVKVNQSITQSNPYLNTGSPTGCMRNNHIESQKMKIVQQENNAKDWKKLARVQYRIKAIFKPQQIKGRRRASKQIRVQLCHSDGW